MKKTILYSLVGLILLFTILLRSELIYVGISPYNHYKLNETETQIINETLWKIRENLENGKFEETEILLSDDGLGAKNGIIPNMKKANKRFGKPISSEFFRSSPPVPVSDYYKHLEGTFYNIFYFTKTERGEYFEVIYWVVDNNNEAKMLKYSATEMIEWQIKSREREKYVDLNYPNEIRIPFGSRFIEIKY